MTPRSPTDPVSITLEAQQWNIVIGALMEAPWRISDPILRAISQQTEQKPNGIDAAAAVHGANGEQPATGVSQ